MRKLMPAGELARDDRFVRITMEDVIFDPRNAFVATRRRENGFDPRVAEAPDSARGLMHGIFVGEIQALEGAGRTCWDFETGSTGGRMFRSSSSSTWPGSVGTRLATSRSP